MSRRFFVPSLLVIVTLAVFAPTLGHDFIDWDDNKFIYENPLITSPSVANTLHFWKEQNRGLYIPVTSTTWSLLAWLSSYVPVKSYPVNPALFHAASLLVHLLGVLVIFSILKMLLSRGFNQAGKESDEPYGVRVAFAAGAGALVFAVHPVQVESVAWASELKDLLCGLFSFLAIREYLAFAFASKSGEGADWKYVHYTLASVFFSLALFSKPAAVIVPLVLLILDRLAVKRNFKEIGFSLAGWFLAAAIFAVIAKTVQQNEAVIIAHPLWARWFIAGDALAFYIYKLALPLQLGIDYGRNPDYVMQQWWIYITWLLPLAVFAAIWFSRQRTPWLAAFLVFIAALMPILGFMAFQFQLQSTVADHYLYIPMLGAAISVSWFLYKHQTKAIGLICAAAILFFGLRSSLQLQTWKNNNTLYTNALYINPDSPSSHINMGGLLSKQKKFKDAIAHYQKALAGRPDDTDGHNNLGTALEALGRLNEAITHYQRAIKEDPDNSDAYYNLGIAMGKKGDWNKAAYYYKKAKQLGAAR